MISFNLNQYISFINFQSRIANAYTEFLLDENCEGEQGPSLQDVNQGNYEKGNANIFEMPVILEQSLNQNASAPLVHNDNQMPQQIIISIPSNPLSFPLKINPISNQVIHTQCIQTDQLTESTTSDENEKLNTFDGDGELVIESILTSGNFEEMNELQEQMVDSSKQQPDTIDSTLNEAEADSVLAQHQVKRQKKAVENSKMDEASSENIAYKTNQMIVSTSERRSSNVQRRMGTNRNDGLPLLSLLSYSASKSLDSQHSEMLTPSKVNIEVDNQRHGFASPTKDISGLRFTETIDLTSDDKIIAGQGIGKAVGLPQPMIQRQISTNGYLKQNSKLAAKAKAIKRHMCKYCGYPTDLKTNLTMHICSHLYACEICKIRFNQKIGLDRHMQIHKNVSQFECSKCRQGFSHKILCLLHENRCNSK